MKLVLIAMAFLTRIAICGEAKISAEPQPPAADIALPASPKQETPASGCSPSGARELRMSGQYAAAESCYRELLNNDESAVGCRTGLAAVLFERGEYEAARSLVARPLCGQNSSCLLQAAILEDVLGRYDQAVEFAKEAVGADADHAASRLLLAQLYEKIGRSEEAIAAYAWFDARVAAAQKLVDDAEWLTCTAVGFARSAVLTQTNVVQRTKHALHEMLQAAYTRLDRTYWPARVAAGDLLRERFNNSAEDGSVSDYLAALRVNPDLADAHLGLGAVALENWNFEEVERRIEAACKTNPKRPAALRLQARKFLFERRYEQAIDSADAALQINPRDVLALSLKAAARASRFDQRAVTELLALAQAVHPRPAIFHRTVADALYAIRQYEDSEREYLRAVELDPVDANARAELGMMYMQWGKEDRAQNALDAAWKLDPFNERTRLTLEVLDSLAKFTRLETPNFIIRYDARKDAGIGEFIADYLEQIHPTVTQDFAATLDEKTIIEVFPTQAAFAVRITGRPWIPTVGACSGRLIALASPRDGEDRMGKYNIARVLKHEYTHTVTLAATKNRIPHWFTEGLAVYQEDAFRDYRWSALLADAVRHNRLFTLESIDWGFMRPKRSTDRTMAYAQSEWMCEFIVERFGYDAILDMLARYKLGETQPEVLKRRLDIDMERFDQEFAVWARNQVKQWGFELLPPENLKELRAAVESHSSDAGLWARLARAEWEEDDSERAVAAARRALEIESDNVAALDVMVQALYREFEIAGSDVKRAAIAQNLEPMALGLAQRKPEGWIAPKALSAIHLSRKAWDDASTQLRRLQQLCPADPTSWRGLAGIYLEQGKEDLALPQLMELAQFEDRDEQIAAGVARIFLQREKYAEARYWYSRALHVNPFHVGILAALADAHARAQDHRASLQSWHRITIVKPDDASAFERAAATADLLRDAEAAGRYARRAVELNPNSVARKYLVEPSAP